VTRGAPLDQEQYFLQAFPESMQAQVDVLVPVYNGAATVRDPIESLRAQTMPHLRIIVVDDGSTDGTESTVKGWAKAAPFPVDVIRHAERRGQPASRRTGIAASSTDWILFGEDDVWLGDGYCSTLLHEATELGASIIAGRIVTAIIPGDFSEDRLVDPPSAVRDYESVFDVDSMEADYSARLAEPTVAPYLHSIALIRRSVFEPTLTVEAELCSRQP